ncbi:retrovirus-related pol polyprotein from transposon TNT 1-94 [Tanacetum coccineum]
MMFLAKKFRQQYSTLTNNRLRTYSNIRRQAYVQGGQVNVQRKIARNSGCVGNTSRNVRNVVIASGNARSSLKNGQMVGNSRQGAVVRVIRCYNCDGEGHFAIYCKSKARVKNSKYFTQKMLLAKKDEARITLTCEEHNFLAETMLDEGEDQLTTTCIMITKINVVDTNSNSKASPTYETDGLSEIPDFDYCYINDISSVSA